MQPSGLPRCPRQAGSAGYRRPGRDVPAGYRPASLVVREQLHERVVELRCPQRLWKLRIELAARAGPRQASERGQRAGAAALPASDAAGSRPPARRRPCAASSCRARQRRTSPPLDECERFVAALDCDRFHAPGPCVPRDDLAVRRVVVDNENALPEELRQACPRAPAASAAPRAPRKARDGTSSPSLPRSRRTRPAHQLDEPLRDREPEPRSAVASCRRRVDLAEGREQAVHPVIAGSRCPCRAPQTRARHARGSAASAVHVDDDLALPR